jgi:hypothetical protein
VTTYVFATANWSRSPAAPPRKAGFFAMSDIKPFVTQDGKEIVRVLLCARTSKRTASSKSATTTPRFTARLRATGLWRTIMAYNVGLQARQSARLGSTATDGSASITSLQRQCRRQCRWPAATSRSPAPAATMLAQQLLPARPDGRRTSLTLDSGSFSRQPKETKCLKRLSGRPSGSP